ncbi:MAG: hypothetical protein C0592_08235 [Marinilabiliales bacterium]|nr:MAG: hypothetical protein C0592_08235 [Marinilabiliales bacterium]
MKKLLIIVSFLVSAGTTATAQFQTRTWINSGHNRAVGWYGNLDLIQEYCIDNTTFIAGEEFALINADNTIFNAGMLKIKHHVQYKNFEIDPFISFQYRPFSKYIREKIFVFGLLKETPHWNLSLGNFSRIYSLSKDMQELYPDDDASSVKEWHNLLYDIEYLFQPRLGDKKMNYSLGVSNQSDFLYQPATIPMLYGRCWTYINERQYVFFETRYQTAGSNNLQADFFGVILKGGLFWAL